MLIYVEQLCRKVSIASKGKTILLIGATIAIILIALLASGILSVLAEGAVIVTLKDEETGKPIGKVNGGYVRVMLGGQDQGYLTDKGETKIEDVEPGTHELVLVIPRYGEKRQFVEVGSGQTVSANLEVDMPNPVFKVGVEVGLTGASWWQNLLGDSEVGHIKVSLANFGDANSVGSSILVLVYRQDDLSIPIARHTIDFPSLVPRGQGGETVTREWECHEFIYGPRESVAIVVFDSWPYTPQNEQVLAEVVVSNSMFENLAISITNYLANNPQLVTQTIAEIVIGWVG